MGGWVYFALDHWFKGALFASGVPRRFSVSPGGRTFTSEIVHGGVLLWCTGGQWCGNRGQFASIQVRRAYHSYTGCNSYTDVLVYVCIVVLVYKYVPSVA